MQAWRKVFRECSVSCGAILEAGGYGLSRKMLLARPAAFCFGRIQCASPENYWSLRMVWRHIILMTGMLMISTSCIACLIMVDHPPVSVWHLAAGRHSGHHHRLMMPTWPNHSSALLNPCLGNETVMHDQVLKGSERWNQGGKLKT